MHPHDISTKKTQQNMLTETCKIQITVTKTQHHKSRHRIDARVHYTILKQHTPPHRHQNKPGAVVQQQQRRRIPSDTQQCADEPHPPPPAHAGNEKAEYVSVPPNSMSTRPDHVRAGKRHYMLLRKEVIQPHLPVRLPCYDFVPIANPTFDSSLPQGVRPPASGVTDFHDVTGGVYKARERIHRSVADLRLLATPTSWGRVADPNPN